MATTSLTVVGNSADSRGLAECRDTVYCTPSNDSRLSGRFSQRAASAACEAGRAMTDDQGWDMACPPGLTIPPPPAVSGPHCLAHRRWTLLIHQHFFRMEGVEVLAHGLNLAVADLKQEVIQVVVDLAAGRFPIRFGFYRHPVALGREALRGHAQPLGHCGPKPVEQLRQLRLGLGASLRKRVGLACDPPGGAVSHQRQGG